MCLWNTMPPPAIKFKTFFQHKGHSLGHKFIDLGVIWKDVITWVCVTCMKSLSPIVQKLTRDKQTDKQDKNNAPDLHVSMWGHQNKMGWKCPCINYYNAILFQSSEMVLLVDFSHTKYIYIRTKLTSQMLLLNLFYSEDIYCKIHNGPSNCWTNNAPSLTCRVSAEQGPADPACLWPQWQIRHMMNAGRPSPPATGRQLCPSHRQSRLTCLGLGPVSPAHQRISHRVWHFGLSQTL